MTPRRPLDATKTNLGKVAINGDREHRNSREVSPTVFCSARDHLVVRQEGRDLCAERHEGSVHRHQPLETSSWMCPMVSGCRGAWHSELYNRRWPGNRVLNPCPPSILCRRARRGPSCHPRLVGINRDHTISSWTQHTYAFRYARTDSTNRSEQPRPPFYMVL